ncbi:oxidoreductase [Thiohalorhabdus denitrificans]|uniref:Choline dehydrogenase n=1 Tax=Thiohalorhabdus denitrificans TaxID=381306 RepID=A0A0P9CCW8_9GAMM|nr:GMC family oxidoreductase [Thiohalorhabdus denitrificans]KPV40722.1 oxidoreductase [Thiohalorhabdus denitrificans]SCY46016.1 Choline dehydrogenase [Thiohalorhabdus denitrificans]
MSAEPDFDVCVVGSGAGGAPVALALAEAGYSVVVLEKGPRFTEEDFYKDELACCRRDVFTPSLRDERHVIAPERGSPTSTADSGVSWWNGNCVGGATNFMSGYFHRQKPVDFRLRSEFGPVDGADVRDWPIGYEDLEPYYARVEREVGVSGRVTDHPAAEPRSTDDFPHPPTAEHAVAGWIDDAAREQGLHPFPVPRAILPAPAGGRQGCSYSGYCGGYGCPTGAKGSSRAALLDRAEATGRCEVRDRCHVHRLESDARGRVTAAEYFHYPDPEGRPRTVTARSFAVACQPVETARLLLTSPGPAHPDGLANGNGLVGRYLLFSAGGTGGGLLAYDDLDSGRASELAVEGPFVNRAVQDWYTLEADEVGGRAKGGTVDFLLAHNNPIARASGTKRDAEGGLVWGRALKRRLKERFTEGRQVRFEVFCDWQPLADSRVTLDPEETDRWGRPVARVHLAHHPRDLAVGRHIARGTAEVLRGLGARDVDWSVSANPPVNLVAGGCRFGTDPAEAVLDPDCRAFGADNLYITDASFMPTGGSVPFTWTIYANAFRVADRIRESL